VTDWSIRRRFLVLRALRWFPTGLLMPVLVLLLLDRGLSPGQVGLCLGVQAVVVLLLELPTGGTADSRGRSRVLLAASSVDAASIALLVVADTLPLIVGVFALQGIYRALESGPLDAWYVDAAQALDPDTDIDSAMAASGTVIGLSIAAGSIASSAVVAVDIVASINPLLVPVILSVVVRIADMVAISTLMTEPVAARSASTPTASQLIRNGLAMIRRSQTLVALLAIEALWGAGIIAFETFTPLRLESVLAEPTDAAALLGPAAAAAWLLAGLSAAAVPTLARRWGAQRAGAGLRLAQGATVAGIAVLAGPVGVLAAYLATMAVHGAANPIHQTLLHRAISDSTQRATVLSANSLTGNLGAAIGAIGLGVIADATTLSTAILTGAAVLATAAPLYLCITSTSGQQQSADKPRP
jgi:MFS transporter, DHA1 family, tetracycline resistance protein